MQVQTAVILGVLSLLVLALAVGMLALAVRGDAPRWAIWLPAVVATLFLVGFFCFVYFFFLALSES